MEEKKVEEALKGIPMPEYLLLKVGNSEVFWKKIMSFLTHDKINKSEDIFNILGFLKTFSSAIKNFDVYKKKIDKVMKKSPKKSRFKRYSRDAFQKTSEFDTDDKIDKRVRSESTEVLKERQEIILDEVYKYLEEKGYI